MSDIRASELVVNQQFNEYGMDEVHTIDQIKHHGDSVLIRCVAGCEPTLDCDEVVDDMSTEDADDYEVCVRP